MKKFIIKSPKGMQRAAEDFAKRLLARPSLDCATVVGLMGDLGSGKTTFAGGFARALGIKKRMLSPTFIVFRRYALYDLPFKNFYHVDVYRIHDINEAHALGFVDILSDSRNIVLIEWADKVKKILPKNTVWLQLKHGEQSNERLLYM